jgi:hypothetical protein
MCALLNAEAREQGNQAPSIDDALQCGDAVQPFSARPRSVRRISVPSRPRSEAIVILNIFHKASAQISIGLGGCLSLARAVTLGGVPSIGPAGAFFTSTPQPTRTGYRQKKVRRSG